MMKKIISFFTVVILLTSFIGCSEFDKKSQTSIDSTVTHEVTDIDGSILKVPENPKRIAAIYGPAYEAITVLGDEDKIVVCSDVQFENFPWAKKIYNRINTIPYLKNVHTEISMEELMKNRPDIVFSFPRPNELKQLQKIGVAAVPGTYTGKLSDTKNQLMVYAKSLGINEVNVAKEYSEYFDEKMSMVKKVTDKIPENQRPSVYYAGIELLVTYGKYSDIPELIEAAGGRAVSKDLEVGNRSQITFEQLVKWNPDYIFIDHGGINEKKTVDQIKNNVYSDGRYEVISAVKKKQIYLTPSGVFYWDMGLQKILLLMYMAKIFHPDDFKNINMINEVKMFYSKFFHYDLTDDEASRILNRENP